MWIPLSSLHWCCWNIPWLLRLLMFQDLQRLQSELMILQQAALDMSRLFEDAKCNLSWSAFVVFQMPPFPIVVLALPLLIFLDGSFERQLPLWLSWWFSFGPFPPAWWKIVALSLFGSPWPSHHQPVNGQLVSEIKRVSMCRMGYKIRK